MVTNFEEMQRKLMNNSTQFVKAIGESQIKATLDENEKLKEMLKRAVKVIDDLMWEQGYVAADQWLNDYKKMMDE